MGASVIGEHRLRLLLCGVVGALVHAAAVLGLPGQTDPPKDVRSPALLVWFEEGAGAPAAPAVRGLRVPSGTSDKARTKRHPQRAQATPQGRRVPRRAGHRRARRLAGAPVARRAPPRAIAEPAPPIAPPMRKAMAEQRRIASSLSTSDTSLDGSAPRPSDEELRASAQAGPPSHILTGDGSHSQAGSGPGQAAGDESAPGQASGQAAGGGPSRGTGTRPRLVLGGDPCASYFPVSAGVDDGDVWVRIRVDAAGHADQARVLAESPRGHGFGPAARACVDRLRFRPASDPHGLAVAGEATLALHFHRS